MYCFLYCVLQHDQMFFICFYNYLISTYPTFSTIFSVFDFGENFTSNQRNCFDKSMQLAWM